MLRRFAATAACILALDYTLSNAPVSGPTNASVITAAMAAMPSTKPANDMMFSLKAKYELLPDDERSPLQPAATEPSIIERAEKAAIAAVDAVQKFTGISKDDISADPDLNIPPAPVAWPKLSREETCNAIELAALEYKVPAEFLGRLIWQESRHNAQAVSPAGARGIAQFMPATASDVGLQDPFDPVASLLKSAKFLRALQDRFGNVGLAAAAYNGGPGRLERWLEAWEKSAKKKRKPALPQETQDYVRIITGKPVTEWVGVSGTKAAEIKHTRTVPCVKPPVVQAKVLEKKEKPVKIANKN